MPFEFFSEVAVNKMNELMENGELHTAPEVQTAEKELWNQLDVVHKEMGYDTYFNLESVAIEYSRVYGEENFQKGFMEGVKFIVQFQTELTAIKKEQSAATDHSHVQIIG